MLPQPPPASFSSPSASSSLFLSLVLPLGCVAPSADIHVIVLLSLNEPTLYARTFLLSFRRYLVHYGTRLLAQHAVEKINCFKSVLKIVLHAPILGE